MKKEVYRKKENVRKVSLNCLIIIIGIADIMIRNDSVLSKDGM